MVNTLEPAARPLIGIPTPTSADVAYNERSWSSYAQAVEQSGGTAVRIALGLAASELRNLVSEIHGICLPGSPADVDPARYGADPHPANGPVDHPREETDFALLSHAEDAGKPLLAICFGMQSLNVWRGGSLVQDLTPVPVNHSAGGQVAIAHTALIAEHSGLGTLLAQHEATRAEAPLADGFLRLPVNTSHHQAVAQPGDDLRICARSPEDGVVEAIEQERSGEHSGRFLLGVQWHPERSFDLSATSRLLFAELIRRARQQS